MLLAKILKVKINKLEAIFISDFFSSNSAITASCQIEVS